MAQETYSHPAENEEPRGLSDAEFIDFIQDDDRREMMFRFANKFVKDEEAAKDVVQDALLKSWRARESFRGDSELDTWLFAIVKNTAKTAVGTKVRHQYVPLARNDNPEPGEFLPPADLESMTETTAIENVAADELAEAIRENAEKHLPARTVIALGLTALGMTYRQAGEQIGLGESATKLRLFRGRRKLKNKLKKDGFF